MIWKNNPIFWARFIFGLHLIYLRASLMAQLVKNSPTMQETWVRSLGWEDPLDSWLENSMDRGEWGATVHEVTKSWTRLSNWTELNWKLLFRDYEVSSTETLSSWRAAANVTFMSCFLLYIKMRKRCVVSHLIPVAQTVKHLSTMQ